MSLKLKIGKKGYVIIPKAIREAAGVEEGDELIVNLNDGITLKPVRKFNRELFRKAAIAHKERLFSIKGATSPESGEAAKHSLEEEFD